MLFDTRAKNSKKEDILEIFKNFLGFFLEPWVFAALIASMMFAIGNYIDEELLKKQAVGTLVIISGLFGFVLMILFGCIAGFTGASLELPLNATLQAIGVGGLEVLWVIPYLYATKRRGALIAGPLLQVIPVIVFALEALLGIFPSAGQLGGSLLLVVGGVLLSLEKEEDENGNVSHSVDWVTIGLMTLSAFITALIYVLFKDVAEDEAGYVAVGFWSSLGMILTTVLLFCYDPYWHEFSKFAKSVDMKSLGKQLVNELMDAGGVYLMHFANIAAVSFGVTSGVVTSFTATQPIAIALVGVLLSLFGAKTRGNKTGPAILVPAIALIVVGTVVVALTTRPS